MNLLTTEERQNLAELVEANGGKIKYKATPTGREPYELCTTTWDVLEKPESPELQVRQFLAFHTLAFAMMGRNVKSVYFNDLIGLPNDYDRFKSSGELRDLKRTKSDYDELTGKIEKPGSLQQQISLGMNNLIALADADPALHYRGSEASVLLPDSGTPAAMVLNRCGDSVTLTVINLATENISVNLPVRDAFGETVRGLFDNLEGQSVETGGGESVAVDLEPFARLWLKKEKIPVDPKKLRQP